MVVRRGQDEVLVRQRTPGQLLRSIADRLLPLADDVVPLAWERRVRLLEIPRGRAYAPGELASLGAASVVLASPRDPVHPLHVAEEWTAGLGCRMLVSPARDDGAAVLVAYDLAPSETVTLDRESVLAIVTEAGGRTSHTAILARSLGIPAIVGLRDARRLLRDGEWAIVDGEPGHLIADPDDDAVGSYRDKQAAQAAYRAGLGKLKGEPATSEDGVRCHLLANIEMAADAAEATANGAEGVGLYRTEFLYMNRKTLPTEEEQYEAYASIVSVVKGPITIRTLDLGADKQVDSGRSQGPTPNNPALGLRAIRLCLKEPDLFRTQVRALLRASRHGHMQIMLPMISSLQEFRQALALIDDTRQTLIREGHTIADDVPVGAMIEVPAAAIAAPILAQQARFFSIGTNDLIQYTLAIDRVDDEVNYLYDPLHPAVLRLIQMTIDAGVQGGIPVAMCGEMAGDPRYTRLLLGLGLTEFSMHPANVLEIKRIIRESRVHELRRRVRRLLVSTDPAEMQDLIAELG
mgnify:CR=1 FL=1